MISTLLISKILLNKYVLIGAGIISILITSHISVYFMGRSSIIKQEQKEVIRIITKYVRDKDKIDEKYTHNFSDERVLSGCIPEDAKNQEHCKEMK